MRVRVCECFFLRLQLYSSTVQYSTCTVGSYRQYSGFSSAYSFLLFSNMEKLSAFDQ